MPRTRPSLKADWMDLPEECFETMTFGELKVGTQFIGMPWPGDNHGHGGFRIPYRVFVKTHDRVMKTDGPDGLPYRQDFPHGRAISVLGKSISDFPLSMDVIPLC